MVYAGTQIGETGFVCVIFFPHTYSNDSRFKEAIAEILRTILVPLKGIPLQTCIKKTMGFRRNSFKKENLPGFPPIRLGGSPKKNDMDSRSSTATEVGLWKSRG